MKRHSPIILFLVLISSCGTNTKSTEVFQGKRENITDVTKRINDINVGNLVIGRSWIYTINDYLLICDHQSPDKGIHIFDKETFNYLASTGQRGRGPNEIVRYGHVGIDSKNRAFYMSDYGKMVMFRFNLDSVLIDQEYKPNKYFRLSKDVFPTSYDFIEDNIIIGVGLEAVDNMNFKRTIAKFDLQSGKVQRVSIEHPDLDDLNLTSYIASSIDENIYVECYSKYDLLTICDLDGNLKRNIYGPNWDHSKSKMDFFGEVRIMGDKIIASYIGDYGIKINEQKRAESVFPTKFLIFNSEGDYLKTLETGYGVNFFCTDVENNRLIIYFEDREVPLAYLNLDGII